MIRLLTPLVAASLAAAPVAMFAAQPIAAPQSSSYSLTEQIENGTSHTLTVDSVTAGNGATIEPHVSSVDPGKILDIQAINKGNGVHLWTVLDDGQGGNISYEADVPKVNTNWSTGMISGVPLGIQFADGSSIGGGYKPTAKVKIVDCQPGGDPCQTDISASSW